MPSTRSAKQTSTAYINAVVHQMQVDDIPRPFKIRGSRYKPLNAIPDIDDEQILITRDQARRILGGISYMTIARLDRSGKLTGIKLNDQTDEDAEHKSTSKKLYHKDEVYALAEDLRKAALEKRRKA